MKGLNSEYYKFVESLRESNRWSIVHSRAFPECPRVEILISLIINETLQPVLMYSALACRRSQSPVRLFKNCHFHMMSTNDSRHYGEWALSSWYDILPGPDRLLEVSTSLNEDDAWRIVHSWSSKLLTAAVGSEKLQGIADALVQQHWNQAKRMGCLGIQFTYINGFYHRFIWRSS